MRFAFLVATVSLLSPKPGVGNDTVSEVPLSNSSETYSSLESREDRFHFLRRIPAPRGLITDRMGRTLAGNEIMTRVVINPASIASTYSSRNAVDRIQSIRSEFEMLLGKLPALSEEDIQKHLQHRPFHPLVVTGLLNLEQEFAAQCLADYHRGDASIQPVYTRTYRDEGGVAHLVGFVGAKFPQQHGPLADQELLWVPVEGRQGIELEMEDELRGEPGLMSIVYSSEGEVLSEQLVRSPRPGKTIVLTIDRDLQNEASKLLEDSGRSGALVLLDSASGDMLASASYPDFDSSTFVPSIDEASFAQLVDDPDAPLFNRAVSGSYPPGSTYKPVVALAGLSSGKLSTLNRFDSPPAMDIDGLEFKNWNDEHEGRFGLQYALLRSSNTWFYQASFNIGDRAILSTSKRLGFGWRPALPLSGISPGNLPDKAPSRRGLANLSIGQGEVLASPLQLASAMTAFANEDAVVRPRLILQTQDAGEQGSVYATSPVRQSIGTLKRNVEAVREGMWGVVHHPSGTGKSAYNRDLTVFGKTGTAQWTSKGHEKRLAWFTGFTGENPSLSFCVLIEGRQGESVSGGRVAAPLVGKLLSELTSGSENFAYLVPTEKLAYHPSINSPTHSSFGGYTAMRPSSSAFQRSTSSDAQRGAADRKPRKGIFSALFGRR
ncbi:MAG: penicillin-binding transpeptidase domain-containing protein [Verrucomicrobiales bacterium]|nr:penicillin-binding transpeptidase domain-containing protein [Verrucomicrobiales bacterium]